VAPRISKKHQDTVRERIKVQANINRLQSCAEGTLELTPAQMKAIEILLRKSLPDLTQVEQHNTGDQKTYLVQVPLEAVNVGEWEQRAQQWADLKKGNTH
jgi:hypothetical protein